MSGEFEKFWTRLLASHAKQHGTAPRQDEIESELRQAKHKPLSDDEVNDILESVIAETDQRTTHPPSDTSWVNDVDSASVEEGVLQLNKNKGESDEEIEKRLSEHRRRLLGEDEEDVDAD